MSAFLVHAFVGYALFAMMTAPIFLWLWLSERQLNERWRELAGFVCVKLHHRVDTIARQMAEEECRHG